MGNVTLHEPGQMPPGREGVELAPGAAQRVTQQANALMRCTDANGREIGWRKMDALEDFDLTEIAGAKNADNNQWMIRATVAMGTREIAGEPVRRPATMAEVRAIIARLGTEGMQAVLAMLGQDDAARPDEGDRAKN